MKITVLGSGTSSGVPIVGCNCDVCCSNDPKDKRLRSSIFIDLGGEHDNSIRYLLIDTGPDLREQALRYKLPRVDAVLFTHSHADHIFGLDDIRMFNFRQKAPIPIYADDQTSEALNRIYGYCFFKDPNYEGGGVPSLVLNHIEAGITFDLGGTEIIPVKIFHGRTAILGFRIGGLAYLTDCSKVPDESLDFLQDLNLLIVSGLRHREHPTHFTIDQAMDFINCLNPKKALLTHIAHEVSHSKTDRDLLQATSNRVALAFDGLEIKIP